MRRLIFVALLASAANGAAQKSQCAQVDIGADPPREMPPVVHGFMSGRIDGTTFPDMRQWGASVVRLQIHPVSQAQAMGKSMWEAWPMVLDSVVRDVRAAGEAGLKVVVDMHEAPVPGVAGDRKAIWDGPDLLPNLCRVWDDLARRLQPLKQYVYGYDLLNEPLDRDELPEPPRVWHGMAETLAHTIRAVDRETWIIWEPGPGYSFAAFEKVRPLSDRRTIYSAHIYDPLPFVMQGLAGYPPAGTVHYPGIVQMTRWDKARLASLLQPAVEFQNRYHVPIYVGEFSVIRWAPHDDAVHWMTDVVDLIDSHHWSWTYHAFREFNGWSLEMDETPWKQGDKEPVVAARETDRARLIKEALRKP